MSEDSDIDWAELIDLFASEYGWTIEYITSLDLKQIAILKGKIYERLKAQNGESVDSNISSSGTINLDENSQDMSYFEKMADGKRNVREDGTVEIII